MRITKEKQPEPEIELFDDDEASDYNNIELNDRLLPRELEEAAKLVRFSKGVMIVVAMPRQGKDLFATTLCYKIKKMFKGRHCVRDERPRSLFGQYILFNENSLLADMERLNILASGQTPKLIKTKKEALEELDAQVKHWKTDKGEVMMQHAAAHFTEFWRYMHNRNPHNPMGKAIGALIKTWGHLDALLIGVAQQAHELDRFSCLPYITHEARCSWSLTRPNTTEVNIFQVRYVGSRGVLEVSAKKPIKIWVDGGKQRPELGIYMIQNPNGTRLSKLEHQVVDIVQEYKLVQLFDLVEIMDDDVQEVEGAVWHLVDKDILRCKRYFDLYNSKSAVALKPKVSFKM